MNPIRMTGVASCLLLLISCDVTSAVHAFIECDGSHLLRDLETFFSLDILLNNSSAAHLDQEGVQNECKGDKQCASNVSGGFAKDRVYLQGSLDIKCEIDHVVCELNGFDSTIGDFRKFPFLPTMEYDVGIRDEIVKKQTLYPSKEVLLTCSVTVGSNTTTPYWKISATRGYFQLPTYQTILANCLIQMTNYVKYDPKKEGTDAIFQCFLGNIKVGSISVIFNDEDNLPFHLFFTSLLVYLHFVILPVLCSGPCLGRIELVKQYRKPSNEKMRLLRGSISLLIALVFIIWWIAVLQVHGWDNDCYFTFFLIESYFLVLYGIVRLISTRCEEPGDRNFYNGRVALSCCAVIVPTVSWLMIKVQQDIPTHGFEVFWWVVTTLSLLAFVSVSQDREMKAWEKQG